PALLRLLPDVDPDDEERSAEFRRLTELDLKQAKAHNVRIVLLGLSKGNDITLTHDEVLAWMKGLNDLRLVLAVRLAIDTEEAQEEKCPHRVDLDEPQELPLPRSDFLTWIQNRPTTTLLARTQGDDDECSSPPSAPPGPFPVGQRSPAATSSKATRTHPPAS